MTGSTSFSHCSSATTKRKCAVKHKLLHREVQTAGSQRKEYATTNLLKELMVDGGETSFHARKCCPLQQCGLPSSSVVVRQVSADGAVIRKDSFSDEAPSMVLAEAPHHSVLLDTGAVCSPPSSSLQACNSRRRYARRGSKSASMMQMIVSCRSVLNDLNCNGSAGSSPLAFAKRSRSCLVDDDTSRRRSSLAVVTEALQNLSSLETDNDFCGPPP